MKQKIDVELYTNWIAKFRGEASNFGYYICSYGNANSEIDLNEEIKKYHNENSDMFLHSKKKQGRIKFKLKKKCWDLIIESEEY